MFAYPEFRLSATDRATLLGDYLPYAESARLPNPPPAVPVPCRDRDDIVFIQLALASEVDFLVSGDADLAGLADALPIVSPTDLRQRLGWREEG